MLEKLTYNPQITTMTTSGGAAQAGNIGTYGYWGETGMWPSNYYLHVTQPPTVCCDDVHVFPCPHCDKCKCGKATLKNKAK